MKIDGREYSRAVEEIKSRKPQLMGFFHTSMEYLSKITTVNGEIVEAVKKLTFASEHLYIHPESIFPFLLERREIGVFSDVLYNLSQLDKGLSHAFLKRYRSLSFPLETIRAEMLFFAKNVSGRVTHGERVLDAVLEQNDPGKCFFLFSQLTIVAAYSPGALLESVPMLKSVSAPRAGNRTALPWDRFSGWLSRSADLFTSGRADEGVQNLLLRSKESRRMLGINRAVLEDLRHVLKIYCASLSGYDMEILGQEVSIYGLKSPYTDGSSIFLPPAIDFFPETERNERIYTALAAEQAASVLFGSFGLDLRAIDFDDELHDRYGRQLPKIADNVERQYRGLAESVHERADGELEVVFPKGKRLLVMNTEHEKFFYSFPAPDFAKELFTLIENARIEFRLSGLYPGLKEDFALLNSFMWEKRPKVRVAEESEAYYRFMAAVECLVQFSLAGRYKAKIQDPGLLRIISELTSEYRKIQKSDATVQDTAKVVFRVYNIFSDNFPLVAFCARGDIREAFPGADKPQYFPEIAREASPELMKQVSVMPVEDSEIPDKEKAIDLGSVRQADRKASDLRQAIADGSVTVFRYPEYNCRKSSYEKNHCTLFEGALRPTAGDYYGKVIRRYMRVHKRIRKRFLSMKPEELEMSRRWLSGDEIHISDALDYTIALMRGESLDEKVYFRKIRNDRDIVVGILVDASSSTDNEVGSARVIDVEKAALCLLSSALDLIGDPFGLYSFYSLGRHRVHFNVIKDFDEPWDGRTQERIGSVKPHASNRDGCAIRHLTMKLDGCQAKTKLLILLSDGIPADVDYGSASASETSAYAIEDTRRAILECRRRNIVPFCLTIDRSAKKYISHLYGDYHHAMLWDVAKLPEMLSRLYVKITR
jgi:nitric oxide reductase NorD protein